jgi:hypothetical protein
VSPYPSWPSAGVGKANIHRCLPEDEADGRWGRERRWNTAYPTARRPSHHYCEDGTRLSGHQQHAVLRRIKSIMRMQRNACTPMQSHHQTDRASIAAAHLDRSVRLFVFVVAGDALWKPCPRSLCLSDTRTGAQATHRLGGLTISSRLIYLHLDLRADGGTQNAAQATWPLALLTVTQMSRGRNLQLCYAYCGKA